MQALEKKRLTIESEQQMKAIKLICRWRNIALSLSAIGVVLIYYGFFGPVNNFFLGVPGIALLILGFVGAAVFNLGIKNARRNVEKMLRAMEE